MNTSFFAKNWYKMLVMAALIAVIGVMAYKLTAGKKQEVPYMKKAADFQMQNVDGSAVSLADLKGKTSLLYFFWSNCPDVCSPTTYRISQIQEKLKEKGVFPGTTALVSITIDPQRDTVSSLKEFGGRFQADWKGWYFLRGDEEKTKALAKDYGVFVNKEKDGSFTHSNVLLLVDDKGDYRTYYTADEDTINIDRIVSDMVQVSKETKR